MKRYLILVFLLAVSLSGAAQSPKAKGDTSCSALPCVVASVSLTDQSQAIPATAIYTPNSSGVFRISAYMSTSTSTSKRASWEALVGWTDNHGFKETFLGDAGSNQESNYSYSVQAVGGQPLLYQMKPEGGGDGVGGMTCDLYITVEQLQ